MSGCYHPVVNRPLVITLALLLLLSVGAGLYLLSEDVEEEFRPSTNDLAADSDDDDSGAVARREVFDEEAPFVVTAGAVEGPLGRVTGRVVDRGSRAGLRDATIMWRWVDGEGGTRSVTSDRRGRFELSELEAADEAWLVVSATDRGTRVLGPVRLRPRDAVDVGTITLGPGGTVSGRVTGPDGAGLPGAQVELREVRPPRLSALLTQLERLFERRPPAASAVTDATGRFRVPGVPRGIWHVTVKASGMATLHRTDVWINGHRLPTQVDFELIRSERLEGRVIDSSGRPVGGARMTVLPAFSGRDLSITVRRQHAVTEEDGRFVVDGLEAGGVEVLVESRGSMTRVTNVVVPGAIQVKLGGRTVEGRVLVAGSGEVVEGVEVLFSSPQGTVKVVSDGEGRFRADALGGEEWRVHVSDERWTVASPSRRARGRSRVIAHDVLLERGFTVRGRVIDAVTGQPIPQAIVFAPRDEMGGVVETRTRRDGGYELNGVLPGTCRIFAKAGGYAYHPQEQQRAHPEVSGRSGDSVPCRDIRLARPVRVVGHVVRAVDGQPVRGARVTTSPYGELQARMLGARTENTVSDSAGRFSLETSWTVDGFVHVRVSHRDFAAAVALVEGVRPGETHEVEVVLGQGVGVGGRVTDLRGEPLAGVRVLAKLEGRFDLHHEQLAERFGFLARTDAAGEWAMQLPMARGVLRFERPGYIQLTPGPVPWSEGGGRIDDVVFAQAQRFFGRIFTPEGALLEGKVKLLLERVAIDGFGWSLTKEVPNGSRFELGGLPRGFFDVTVLDLEGRELGRAARLPTAVDNAVQLTR